MRLYACHRLEVAGSAREGDYGIFIKGEKNLWVEPAPKSRSMCSYAQLSLLGLTGW